MVRPGRKYPRGRYWIQQRNTAMVRAGKKCEVTGEWLGFEVERPLTHKSVLWVKHWLWRRAVHHIIAERFARKWIPGCDPHILANLLVITPSLHAKITALEAKLNKTDWLGYRTALYRLGFPMERLDAAFSALCASVKK